MPKSPEDLRSELDSKGEPPAVDSLVDGSGVPAQSSTVPCDQIHCDDIQALISDVQQWLDDAKSKLGELDNYINDDELERIIAEAEDLRDSAEDYGFDPSDYQDILDDARQWKLDADTRYRELHDQKIIEIQTRNALEGTHYHCCVEYRWYHDWLHGE